MKKFFNNLKKIAFDEDGVNTLEIIVYTAVGLAITLGFFGAIRSSAVNITSTVTSKAVSAATSANSVTGW